MRPAGFYCHLFTWSVHVYGTQDTFSQPAESTTDGGSVWGYFETPSSNRGQYLGADENVQIGLIRFPGYQSIKILDTFTDALFGETWEVLSVHRDQDFHETVCEVRKRG